jgi:hypothetical protein
MKTRLHIVVLVAALVAVGCSGGGAAATCDDLAAQTIDLLQELIDDVDAEFDSMSIQEFIAQGENLPSLESFRDKSAAIDARAEELGCTEFEITAGVAQRVGELTAKTRLGQFVISLLTSGGL